MPRQNSKQVKQTFGNAKGSKDNVKKAKKRDRKFLEENSNVMAEHEPEPKKNVKRKIDLDQGESSQMNNNATKTNENKPAMTRVSARVDSMINKGSKHEQDKMKQGLGNLTRSRRDRSVEKVDGHVQWTKEFLDKVRKSNAKVNSNKNSKFLNNGNSNKNDVSFQKEKNVVEQCGDGIDTSVDVEILSEEELDYEDDLSLNGMEEIEPSSVEMVQSSDRPNEMATAVQPCSSTAPNLEVVVEQLSGQTEE